MPVRCEDEESKLYPKVEDFTIRVVCSILHVADYDLRLYLTKTQRTQSKDKYPFVFTFLRLCAYRRCHTIERVTVVLILSGGSVCMLISIEAAQDTILAACHLLESEAVTVWEALHRRLAVDITAPHDVPPFRNAAMDGYAVRYNDVADASVESPVCLRVIGEVAAGIMPLAPIQKGQAVRIMTGAPVPDGATAVVRFEETSEAWAREHRPTLDNVAICRAVSEWENVRHAGEDIRSGTIVLTEGTMLQPAHIGILASLGYGTVSVTRRPRVAILATGDELVPADAPLTPGKIRNSNEYTTAALVRQAGGIPVPLGIARDTVESVAAKLREGVNAGVDLLLTSAGVSVGDYDVVKNALAREGEMAFWQVAIKPGKPLAFGKLHFFGHTVPLLGLPGNPVAAMVAFHVFARPAIRLLAGRSPLVTPSHTAILCEPVTNSGRRHYMRARAWQDNAGAWRVTTRESGVTVQGSGILSAMVWANCFAIVPDGAVHLPEGTPISIELFYPMEE